jgi:hypothetical protein
MPWKMGLVEGEVGDGGSSREMKMGPREEGPADGYVLGKMLPVVLLVAAFGVTATVSHFVAMKFMTEVGVLAPVGMFPALRSWAMVAMLHIVVIIYVAVEIVGPVKPRAGSDEDSTREP